MPDEQTQVDSTPQFEAPQPGFREVLPAVQVAVRAPQMTSPAAIVADAQATEAVPALPRGGRLDRDRYIDVLRVLALGRVVLYHLVGWAWLTIAFPSMGIMFALAGALTAASLDRQRGRHYVHVLRRRVRRLLPPYWAFAVVMIATMVYLGWRADESGNGGPDWGGMVYWLLPLAEPPSSMAARSWTIPLWYVCAYLWLVLLSPALLWMFRRWPLQSLAAPILLMAGVLSGVLVLWGPFEAVTLNVITYAGCWMLGFAHHDGRLRRLPLWWVLLLGTALAAAGLAWAVANPDPEAGVNVTDIPVSALLYSLGIVLILLRLYVNMSWLTRVRWLDALVAAVNRRALTIYLWGNVCIDAAFLVAARFLPPDLLVEGSLLWVAVMLTVSWTLIWVVVLALGWVEDLAAGRPPRLSPLPRRQARHDGPRRHRRSRTVRYRRRPAAAGAASRAVT